MPQPELCVIFNPCAGRGLAARRLEKLRHTWGDRVHLVPTAAPGHGIELARQASLDGFAIVAAAGGDGTVHEVANGLLLSRRSDVQFGILPIGSANDYAHSVAHNFPDQMADAPRVDVGLVREPGGRERYFVCCLGLGLNGAVTLEARRIKRLQGLALYGLATLRALWYHYGFPRTSITLDGQAAEDWPTLMLSVMLGRREGGFVLAPDARLDDGWFDYVHAGDLSRWEVLRFLPRLALAGPPRNHAKVRLGRCRTIALRSEKPLTVHLDGEFFCTPEDKIHEMEIHLQPAALSVAIKLEPLWEG